uniref:Uncharacterized protein n=1 Tax=Rhizophora mucronata TaxID=61149 RepID=A0A2P2QXD2_RHIMU
MTDSCISNIHIAKGQLRLWQCYEIQWVVHFRILAQVYTKSFFYAVLQSI